MACGELFLGGVREVTNASSIAEPQFTPHTVSESPFPLEAAFWDSVRGREVGMLCSRNNMILSQQSNYFTMEGNYTQAQFLSVWSKAIYQYSLSPASRYDRQVALLDLKK